MTVITALLFSVNPTHPTLDYSLEGQSIPTLVCVKMAWSCSGRTNAELVSNLLGAKLISSTRVADAMRHVDRAFYAPHSPYQDSPQTIGYDATISAPHMHAHAAENLLPFLHEGSTVLDVGSGSGYLTSIFAHLVGKTGKVIGVDHIPQLVELATNNVQKDNPDLLKSGNMVFVTADGRKGVPEHGPYDAIHVGAAAPTLPQALVDQLKAPGRMFIPIGTAYQSVYQIDKDRNGNVNQQELFGVRYVPLTDRRS